MEPLGRTPPLRAPPSNSTIGANIASAPTLATNNATLYFTAGALATSSGAPRVVGAPLLPPRAHPWPRLAPPAQHSSQPGHDSTLSEFQAD